MLEMFAFLATWPFWICLVAFVVLLGCEAYENRIIGLGTVFISVWLLQWLGDIPIFQYIVSNPFECVGWVAGYFLVGALYAPLKWYFFVLNEVDEYNDEWEKFCGRNNLDPSSKLITDPELAEKWARNINNFGGHKGYPPQAGKHKSRIMGWIGYWPISVVWWVLDDFVRRVTRAIYNMIADTLQAISDRVFRDKLVVVDVPPHEKKNWKSIYNR